MTDDSTTSPEPSAAAETSGASSPKTPPRAPRSPRTGASSTPRKPATPRKTSAPRASASPRSSAARSGSEPGDADGAAPRGSAEPGDAAKKPRLPRAAAPSDSTGETSAPRAPRRPATGAAARPRTPAKPRTAAPRTPAKPRTAADPRAPKAEPATAAENVASPRDVAAAPAVADPLPEHVAAAVVVPPRPPLPEADEPAVASAAADDASTESGPSAGEAPSAGDAAAPGDPAEVAGTESSPDAAEASGAVEPTPPDDAVAVEASPEETGEAPVSEATAEDTPAEDAPAETATIEADVEEVPRVVSAATVEEAVVLAEEAVVADAAAEEAATDAGTASEDEVTAGTAAEGATETRPAALGFGPPAADGAVPALEVRGLVKRFGDEEVVHGVDLVVPAGTFYGIVGPNGAGKTTTLSMIAGLLRADSGEVLVNGLDSRDRSRAVTRLVGVLPDRFRTFDRLTGRQLLYYCGVLRGLDAATTERRATDLARAFDLVDALGRPVADYSAGMTKKVLLAGALIHAPRLLVLDEPFEAVDPMSAAAILEILGGYVAHGGTVLLSSHGMELVERVCSRVAVLVDGRIVADGTLDDVRGGGTLEERFVELTGGAGEAEGLEWLHTFSG